MMSTDATSTEVDQKTFPVQWNTEESASSKMQVVENRAVVTNDMSAPLQQSLATIQSPPITSMQYGIKGQLQSENVDGMAYLEMWSHFPNGSYYFTKTLAQANGPMGVISGNTSWREFMLPFDRTGAPIPTKIEMRLVMPGKGTIELRDVVLVDQPLIPPMAPIGNWIAWIVGALVATAAVVFGLTMMAVSLIRNRRQSELRKMSALDIS